MDPLQSANRLAVTGVKAGLDLIALLARKGIVSPDEVEAFGESITEHLRHPSVDAGGHAEIRDRLEDLISEPLAEAKLLARENWKG